MLIVLLGSAIPDRQFRDRERAVEFIGKVKEKKTVVGDQSNQLSRASGHKINRERCWNREAGGNLRIHLIHSLSSKYKGKSKLGASPSLVT